MVDTNSVTEHSVPRSTAPGVLLIGTLDTKGSEVAYVAAALERLGCRPVVVDSGVRGEPTWDGADFTRAEVAEAAGATLEQLQTLPRGDALAQMAEGVKSVALSLVRDGLIEGALCLGGAGVSLAVPAFDALGLGFPKLLVTPLASGARRFDAFVGTADVVVMHSVADIMGVNPVTEPVYLQAAGFVAGAVGARRSLPLLGRDEAGVALVAASMNGNTTPALMRAKERLSLAGVELVTFHANGVGGRAMEKLAAQGLFAGLLDYTTTELAGHMVGGLMSAGPDRMEVAGRRGIPQVLVPGCLDLITTGEYEETLRLWPGRVLYRHNPAFTLVRLNREEMAALGGVFAEKANHATGLTHICVPLRGFSVPNHPGGPFWDPDADLAFVTSLQEKVSPKIEVECVDAHINDPLFIDRVVSILLGQLRASGIELAEEAGVMQ